MRARVLLSTVAALILVTVPAAAGCSSQETGSSTEMDAPTAMESAGDAASGYATVDVQTAYDALSANPAAQLVDVREPAEWAETGVPEGAVLIPSATWSRRPPRNWRLTSRST
jgi:hypothetical protein